MIAWFAGGAIALVWLVFRDPALSYSMVVVGALVPDAIDLLTGSGAGHSVIVGGLLLVTVMLVTRGRRRLRRRALGVPIGFLVHLILDGVWLDRGGPFWWPLTDTNPAASRIATLDRPIWLLVAMEIVGVGVGVATLKAIQSDRQARRAGQIATS